MKSGTVLCLFSLLAVTWADEVKTLNTVIEKLESMEQENNVQQKKEEIFFQNYKRTYEKVITETKAAIEENKENIETFQDESNAKQNEMDSLTEGIKKDNATIQTFEQDAQKSKDNRDDAQKEYTKVKGELEDTIQACKDANKKLKDTQGGAAKKAFLQETVTGLLELATFSARKDAQLKAVNILADAVSEDPKALTKDGHVKKKTFHLAEVIEMIKELKEQFEADLRDLEAAETNALNSYALEKQARDDQTEAAKDARDLKQTDHTAAKKARDEADKNLKDERKDLGDNEKTLSDTTTDLEQKTSEWNTRSATRADENAAITKAIDILRKSAGVRESNYRAPAGTEEATSFIQVEESPKARAIALIRAEATKVHSQALERLALMMSTRLSEKQTPGTTSPFDAVNNMIEKMMSHLRNEQREEREHKLWCDKEVSHTKTDKADLEEKIKDLEADIKELKGSIQEDMQSKDKATGVLNQNLEDMKALREERQLSKADNKQSIKDAVEAQNALKNARAVLTAHYEKSGHDLTADEVTLIQKQIDDTKIAGADADWKEEYTGNNQGASVIALLTEIEGDYDKMESETEADEASQVEEFKKLIADYKVDNAGKTSEIEQLTRQLSDQNAELASKQRTLKRHRKEHEDTVQYMVELTGTETGEDGALKVEQKERSGDGYSSKNADTTGEDQYGACIQNEEGFKARQQARDDEIEALKKARGILKDAFSQKKRQAYEDKKGDEDGEGEGEGEAEEEVFVQTGFLEPRRHKF